MKETRKKYSTEIVKAWFRVVINPLIRNLEVERQFLINKNWTWNFQQERLSFILLSWQYLEAEAIPIYEQFCKEERKAGKAIQYHDNSVKELQDACAKMQSEFEKSEDFQAMYKSHTTFAALEGKTLNDILGAISEKEGIRLIAQYVVNDIRPETIPDHYTTARFWRNCGAKFLAMQIDKYLRHFYEPVIDKGDNLLAYTNSLMLILKDRRANLSLEYGVPPAPEALEKERELYHY